MRYILKSLPGYGLKIGQNEMTWTSAGRPTMAVSKTTNIS